MTSEEVLGIVQEAVRVGKGAYAILNPHCRDRMKQRGASAEDIRRAITSATDAQLRDNGSWRIRGGTDTDGDPLVVVVQLQGTHVLIVTILDANEI